MDLSANILMVLGAVGALMSFLSVSARAGNNPQVGLFFFVVQLIYADVGLRISSATTIKHVLFLPSQGTVDLG